MFSVIGSLITTIITVGLNAILYADVIRKESEKRESIMKNLCRIYIYKGESEYRYKLRKGMFKIKTVFIIIKSGKSAALQQNSILSDNENENENFHDNSKVDLKRRNVNLNSLIKNRELDLIDYNNKCINDYNENENLVNDNIVYEFNTNGDDYLKICRNRSFSIDPKYDSKLLTRNIKNKNKISTDFIFKQRNFVFSEIQTEQIECMYLHFKRIEIIPPLKKKFEPKVFFKQFLVMIVFFVIWYYLLYFIQIVYQNYGQNFVKICIMPLVSMLFINLVITANIMLLIATIGMYYFGKQIYSIKQFSIKKIIFNALVPITASNHHQSILAFRLAMNYVDC